MRHRRVLVALAGGLAVGLAGCSTDGTTTQQVVDSAAVSRIEVPTTSVTTLAAAEAAEESIAPDSSSVNSADPTASSSPASSITPPPAPSSPATAVAPVTTQPQPTTAQSAFTDATSLAAELSIVEQQIRVDGVPTDELAALGLRQQLAYRAVSAHPEWHQQLIDSVDPVAATPLSFHLAARRALADHAASRPPRPPATELPAWTIVEPLPADELLGYYKEAEALTGVPWQYLAAIHFQETRMGRIAGVSTAGAVGPMQFLPATWEGCCEGDPTVARDAIIGAGRYLVDRGAPEDMQAALNGYNPNSGYVGAVTAYAENMIADERAYLGYHGWDVFFTASVGTIRLPIGYATSIPIDAATYLAEHPEAFVPSG